MRTIRIATVSVLALTWVLLTSHCHLEALPGFEFLRCTAEAQTSTEGGDPCEESGCCSVESARYQAPRQQDIAPVVIVAIIPAHTFGLVEPAVPKEIGLGLLTASPPEFLSSWQFSLRTALPPRAPSFIS